MATASLPAKPSNGALSPLTASSEPAVRLLPPHSPPAEALDAVERLAQAAEKAAHARFELMVHKATSKAQDIVDDATDKATGILKTAGMMAAAGVIALSAWIFLTVGAALALRPLVGPGYATLIVGAVQLIAAGALFFVAKAGAAQGHNSKKLDDVHAGKKS